MMKYCDWIKLHESMGSVTLGMGGQQNMGLHGRPKNDQIPEEDDENLEGSDEDEENPDEDAEDLGDEDSEEDVDDQIGDEESDDEDMGDEDMDDEEDMPKKKAPPMGDFHDDSPFMKKESCDDSEEDVDEDDVDNHEKDPQDDKELAFMQKKGMKSGKKKIKKKCSADMKGEVKMCSKCKSEKVKKENVSEEDDFLASLQKTHNVGTAKKHSSGMNEDMLILPPEVKEMSFDAKPGDVGYSPDTRLGLAESFSELLRKVENLENKLKK